MIQELIDKQDTFEIVRDQIAGILKAETTNQMALATAGGKDPDDWKLRIFTERANPFETWLNQQTDTSPIINIWYDNSSFDMKSSNVIERQASETIYNIDCYGYGGSSDNAAGGHNPGDKAAAFEAQKAFRLVRNILMVGEYTYLGLRGTVWGRWPQSMTVFQPQIGNEPMQNIVGARFALRAKFNEFSPQYVPTTLEYTAIAVYRSETGEIYLQADYDYT